MPDLWVVDPRGHAPRPAPGAAGAGESVSTWQTRRAAVATARTALKDRLREQRATLTLLRDESHDVRETARRLLAECRARREDARAGLAPPRRPNGPPNVLPN